MHRRPPQHHHHHDRQEPAGCHCAHPRDAGVDVPGPVRPGLSVVVGLALAANTLTALTVGAVLAALLVLTVPGLSDLLIDLATGDGPAVLAAGAALCGLLVAVRLHGRCHRATARHRAAHLHPSRTTAIRAECYLHLGTDSRVATPGVTCPGT
jgi:hypothetical protein